VTVETIIFDLDGTISDPFVGISKSVNYALDSLGYDSVDPEKIRPLIGPPLNEIFEHLLGALPESSKHALIDKYRERYATIGYAENRIYDDIPGVIGRLAAAGYKLGICTAKRADYAQKIVELFALERHFSFVDGGGIDVTKSAQLARIIARGINPRSAMMVGDREGDIKAAQKNRIGSIGVLWGFGDLDELSPLEPDHLVRTPAELQSIFV
jgi:phosphoglycolate phosphatase